MLSGNQDSCTTSSSVEAFGVLIQYLRILPVVVSARR
uniref:Uncharacterized protein n=1 Tax=Arundo donax TaxID=35708 RepID=A0A0A8XVH0_ARUDO